MRADEALQAAAADDRAAKVTEAMEKVQQAGFGLHKVASQLSTGVPQGNETFYLTAIAGYVIEASLILQELAIPVAQPEASEKPRIALDV